MIKFRARRELRMMDKNLRVLLATEVDSCTPDPCNEMKIKQRKLQNRVWVDFYRSIAEGDLGEFDKFLQLFQESKTKLTAEWLRDPRTGKTCLMKALLNLNDNTQEMVEKLISFAEASDSLEQLINAEYTDREYKGQTALHIAIERRCKTIVQLLVEKGADINAKAQGRFFKPKKLKHGFYFGELPLSLAACTNQPDIVTLLMASGRTDVRAQDAWGNCILHALVTVADDSEDNTTFVTEMYDMILMSSQDHNLEGICNLRGLNPLQLAAKLGKFKIFSHILCREFKDKKHLNLSRKITDWAYGPVSSSLYDITEVDTNHQNSVLEIVVHNTKIQNRHELLSVEPLNTLLEEKWLTFGAHMFTITCIVYVLYIIGFTTVYYNQAERYQSLISENLTSTTSLQLFGEISSFTAAWVVIIKEGLVLVRLRPSDLRSIVTDAWFHILFFLQALMTASSAVLCWARVEAHLLLLVPALALGWINILYFTRGFKSMGIYSVILQKVLLTDVLRFLFVYLLFLIGFSVALASLIDSCPKSLECSPYLTFNTVILELFKLTLGLGDLQIQQHAKYPQLFLLLLGVYVVLTFVLLLNMLIALMSETVEDTAKESKNIWKLQRARMILNLERSLPKCLRRRFQLGTILKNSQGHSRRYIRINEVNWTKWKTSVARIHEDPGNEEEEQEDKSSDEVEHKICPGTTLQSVQTTSGPSDSEKEEPRCKRIGKLRIKAKT
ncbi:transient receptor potential cation channel subfamily V member 3 isoform X1 [Callorhinchus milii]|uniref:transient receptor potential cation channel subfamily V member 3 isoform X1 n=2 Tax=Callorhinchus milii TaxID=7868 RepID=UPI001C3F6D8A|nr:transient receptor potential cation channel subfamily V member 3 isoform X1 [Callorhinchus milii]